ncbi:MAG: LacI family DNA-binding transcriptional regulator [Chloroflexi bacterium]|jgi:LacI family transcriptional regulator|nr:LacI family DNA-binding transcriptional regulator [Chloroflexota bacterium]MBT4003013.1 LacI family DNA-binding transcriptional regulator [Chloroflexota bacterium]MBT4306613.1 LacI family DNA-binding transcriptional regulator [Chloroflexota bacterium]MBT4533880.1 LacI family DNA-binding transcriptional regulator [Chloroflexota bacterium]MBT4681886.1 LacI family DNA-binding transcriptional regulator [Chloroflexota bacterium]
MKSKNITIQDVANLAKVSTTTVSHVINETRPVSKDLRDRVNSAIVELGYRPNILARGLRRNETTMIGLIVPNNANPFYAEVSKGVESVCFEKGYNVILCNSDRDIEKEVRYTDLLTEKRVDGILFVGAWIGENTSHLENTSKQNIPIVVVDRFVPNLDIDLVVTDNVLGGWLATSHLYGLGHKRIACIAGTPQFTPNAERIQGYEKALDEANISINPDLIIRSNFQFEGGYKAAQQLLSQEDRPTAIFACNDLMAIGAMRAAIDLGYSIPEDLSIIGYDDVQMTKYTNPQLTTISQPMFEMGNRAAEMLIERIHESEIPQRKKILEPNLVVRGTTAKYTGAL